MSAGRARGTGVGLAIAAIAAAMAVAGPAQARVVAAGSVLPPGQSGFVPTTGTNPGLTDQIPLYENFVLKPATFDERGTPETPRPGVRITRDPFGVPSIRGTSDRLAWWGAGYAVAEDRLVELELIRRQTKGTLAEILGPGRLPDDIIARRDFYTDAQLRTYLRRLPAGLRARLDGYAEGVNAWIARTRADAALVPQELALLRLNLAPWTALDSARIGVYLARTVPSSDGAELRNARALRAIGPKAFETLLPLRSPDPVVSVPRSEGLFPSQPGRSRADERRGFDKSRRLVARLRLPSASASRTSRGPLPRRGGSIHYAIRAPGGRALVSSSPQLGFSIPELFVELEVHAPGLDVRGATAPGLPAVALGHNGRIAWGITSGLEDDDDLYAEQTAGRERYRYKGRTREMRCRNETFRVSGAATRRERFCRTVHGPVQARAGKVAYARRYAIWGRELETLVGFDGINRAGSVQDAARAVRRLTWNENTIVADSAGNIGWWHPGLLPLKPRTWDERLPFPGTGEAEWRGFLKFSQLPQVVNPRQGWIANWNNLPSAGWTNGDSEALERLDASLHRGRFLSDQVARARRGGTYAALLGVDRTAGTIAQQRPLLTARLQAAARGASGPAKAVLDTLVAWDGSYDRVDAAGTVDPGVGAWEAFRTAASDAALRPLGGRRALPLAGSRSNSHFYDVNNGESYALRTLTPAQYRAAAATAAGALQRRFGTADPAGWRQPRRLYDVTVQGLAPKPTLKFFDRGTYQIAAELGR